MMYTCSITLIKLSILSFAYRLIDNTKTYKRWLLHFNLVYTGALFFTSILGGVFACKPMAASWDLLTKVKGASCIDMSAFVIAASAIYSASDAFLLLLPIAIVWDLQTSRKKKFAITFLFSLGFLAFAVSFAKMFFVNPIYKSFDPGCEYKHFYVPIQGATMNSTLIFVHRACYKCYNI
jgi:hypothetical protein